MQSTSIQSRMGSPKFGRCLENCLAPCSPRSYVWSYRKSYLLSYRRLPRLPQATQARLQYLRPRPTSSGCEASGTQQSAVNPSHSHISYHWTTFRTSNHFSNYEQNQFINSPNGSLQRVHLILKRVARRGLQYPC